jgi:hypothetical protein
MPDPDKIIETWIDKMSPVWGPFYALFYIVRLLWREIFTKKQ